MEKLSFPSGFLFGSATSSYQVEGGIEGNDWARDFPAGLACDHYHRYEADFDLLSRLHQNAYRFSFEWSRVEPAEGKWDEAEVEHYRKMLHALRARKIKTVATLHHFTNPLWVADRGGWANSKIVFYFSRFAKKMLEEYGDLVDVWITLNEPQVYAFNSHAMGVWPPKKKNALLLLLVFRNQIAAHREVYRIFHRSRENVVVGIAEHCIFFEPFRWKSFLDQFSAKIVDYFWNRYFLNRIRRHLDCIGINYYVRKKVRFPCQIRDGNGTISDIGWEIYPAGVYHVLRELRRYGLPLYVTENGVADAQDRLRKDFIRDHLFWIHKALQEGVDVRGYFYWSLLDNFEWEKGFEPRFGLVEVDYKTMERKVRPSAYYYAEICKNNALLYGS